MNFKVLFIPILIASTLCSNATIIEGQTEKVKSGNIGQQASDTVSENRNDDTYKAYKMYNGLGFVINTTLTSANASIYNRGINKDYSVSTLGVTTIELGILYKSFGFKYALPISKKEKDSRSNNYSVMTGFTQFGYFKWWGYDLYWHKHKGFANMENEVLEHYRPGWTMEDGFYWVQGMQMQNTSLNLYGKILGKHRLNDYFTQPTEVPKSKACLFGMISTGQKHISNTSGIIMDEAFMDFPELYNGFEFKQKNLDVGLGVSGTLFIKKTFYASAALAAGYGYSILDNNWSSGTYKGTANNGEWVLMNMKGFMGWQKKNFKIEGGYIFDFDEGSFNKKYDVQIQTDYGYFKLTYRMKSKEERNEIFK